LRLEASFVAACKRLEMGDQFMQEIVSKGKVMYDRSNRRMGAKAEDDWVAALELGRIRVRRRSDG
jgi:hypothetical protein